MPRNRAKTDVKEDFDKLTDYDANRDPYYFERRLRRILKAVPKDKNIKVLDFGGGSGLFSLRLKEKGYKNIYLVDLSPVQIKQAKDKGLKNVYCGDENFVVKHFSKDFFDFVIMADVIEHLENPALTLHKLNKVMKPSGIILITFPNPLWVPALNLLGNVGLKLKGKDNKIYFMRVYDSLKKDFFLVFFEGHMLMSKMPSFLLRFSENVEKIIPAGIKRKICILSIAALKNVRT